MMRNINDFRQGIKYILLNEVINRIPSWHVRRLFYNIMRMKIGKGSRIGIHTVIHNPENIVIGERTIINEWCHLDGRGGITIGNDVSISFGSVIITASHLASNNDFQYYMSGVTIGDNVWVGANAIILDGSIVNSFTVIGAGAVFKGVSEEKGIYAGNPAKLLKRRIIDKKYSINYNPFFR